MEVADVIRAHADAFVASRGGSLPIGQSRVLGDIAACRTSALGGHVEQCDRCAHRVIAYNSCRNRHCPKCQASARADWVGRRQLELLPVPYFHVVFTLPSEIATIALQNKRVVYELLLRGAGETLCQIAAEPRHLGAKIGVLSVLHTWGQNLRHHPHAHCIVAAGGIAADGSHWVASRPSFFLPVKVLSRVFRGKLLEGLKAAFRERKLQFHGALVALRDPDAFRAHLAPLYEKDWVVYSKPPFGGPEQALKYLGRYTHRVAISNGRLVALKDARVSFLWKDYAHGCRQRLMTLSAVEFIRRLLLHLLPKGFVRIRYYGFMANRCRAKKLELCRQLLSAKSLSPASITPEPTGKPEALRGEQRCPVCGQGILVRVSVFEAGRAPPSDDRHAA